ncbi:unnamed protein product [Symbiodinium sp. CCMP2456]|nr:unnamed protein product [Symbiodinium sp. CCMP2456]
MDLLRQGLQDICCTSRWHPTIKARLPRRRWNERLLPEKKARLEDVDFEVGETPAVLESYDEEMAVLVSDLQGFTSTVRACGIVHFASIIMRKRQLCWPILTKYSAVKVTTEADNLIVAFSAVSSAVRAALEMREVIHAYNRSLKEDRQHFSIQLSGIGVHAGKGLYLNEHGDLLGEVARGAYYLGEDLCEESAILVSQSVRSKLLDEPFFAPAVFREAGEEPNSKIRYFSLEGDFDLAFDLVPADDQRYLAPSLLPLAQRHGVTGAEDLTVLDRLIGQHFKPCTVLMFRGDLGPDAARTVQLTTPIFQSFSGQSLEAELWIFERPADAVNAALAARDACRNAGIGMQGWGVDSGDLLIIPGTDVHWGDAVNTASKLGQDLADENSILITPKVRDACRGDGSLMQLQMLGRSARREGCVASLVVSNSPSGKVKTVHGASREPDEQMQEVQVSLRSADGHRRGSSVGSTTRPRRSAQQGAKSQGHAATATSWNDLATLSPQVLLDRFTKGVEKGRQLRSLLVGQWKGSTVHAKSSTCTGSAGAGVNDCLQVSSERRSLPVAEGMKKHLTAHLCATRSLRAKKMQSALLKLPGAMPGRWALFAEDPSTASMQVVEVEVSLARSFPDPFGYGSRVQDHGHGK